VIFVDQFEEIFIRHDQEARDRFSASLAATLAEGKGRVRFVLSLREDFLARLSEFRERIPNIFHNEFRLAPLSEAESRAAIVEPARLLGLEVEPELMERLIADLSREGVDPPQLQIVCDTLYDALEHGEKRLTLKSYLALGETRKILGNYLERVLHEFPPPERDAARELLKSLVTSEKTKTVAQIADLARAAGRPEDEASRILAELSNRRLIRRVQREEGYWYELTHEYLVEEISRWLSEKEMQLKKLRELLEQAIRNHRNLGILMPAAQLRLVQAQEDDLNLCKEERQFLRESAQALSTRRRRLAAGAAVAALLLVVLGVTWRYVYLRTHVFIQAQDKEYIDFNSGNFFGTKQAYRLENIRVYAGSPARWWLDARLGFPKPVYQTDFELDQLDPARRDAVKTGLVFPRNVSVQNEICNMLQPDVKVRFLITTGRLDEALKFLRGLYKDRSVNQDDLDGITTMLGYSGAQDEGFARDAVGHAFRLTTVRPSFGNSRAGPLVGLLANLPDEHWRTYIAPLLSMPATRAGAVEVLGLMGNLNDVPLINPYVDTSAEQDEWGDTKSSAISALIRLGDCSALPTVRQLLRESSAGPDTQMRGVDYIRHCGGEPDLSELEQFARRLASAGAMGASYASYSILTMYAIDPHASLAAIKRMLSEGSLSSWKAEALGEIAAPELLPDLRSTLAARQPSFQAQAASALAERGDDEGLAVAAGLALDKGQEMRHRTGALAAFQFFKGADLERFLLSLFKASQPQEGEIRAAALRGLRWYDDDETLEALALGLHDNDGSVRAAAVESLTSQSSTRVRQWLHQRIQDRDGVTRVYAGQALQTLEAVSYQDVFKNYLEQRAEATNDYGTLVESIIGLRDSYIAQPEAVAVEALRSPRRDVRLAATLALTEHPHTTEAAELLSRAPKDNDPWFHLAALRAQWAINAAHKAATVREEARGALTHDNVQRAWQLLDRVGESGTDYQLALKMAFSAGKPLGGPSGSSVIIITGGPGYLFDAVFSPKSAQFELLRSETRFKRRPPPDAVQRLMYLLSDNPGSRKAARDDPYFASLRGFYEFRVLTGMQEPITVEKIKLPQPNSPSPKASVEKSK